MKYGYLRVSTDKQNYERQLFILQEHNLDKIYEETISGTKKACGREQFELLLNEIQKGDEVYFESMSRMARSMQDLIDTTNLIVKQKKAKTSEQRKRTLFHLLCGTVLLFLAVVLSVHGIRHVIDT